MYTGPDPGFIERGGVAPLKDYERQKGEEPGRGLGVLPQKNVKIHVCQMNFPAN